MAESLEFLTGVGRLVQGSPFVPNTKDATGNPLVYKTGAKMGQPREDYYMAIALPKTDPSIAEMIAKMQQVAQAGFPGGQYNAPTFAWKIIDGDGVDAQGQPYANREGFAGHMVFKFSGGYPPKCYTANGNELLTDPNSIKRGYYIRIYGSTTANGSAQQPGVYLNHSMVELIGYGQEIISGPDGAAVFGAAPVATLPPGASATPLAPATPMAAPVAVPGVGVVPAGTPGALPMVGMPAQAAIPGQVPAQAAIPGQVPAQAAIPGQVPAQAAVVQPHPGFVAG